MRKLVIELLIEYPGFRIIFLAHIHFSYGSSLFQVFNQIGGVQIIFIKQNFTGIFIKAHACQPFHNSRHSTGYKIGVFIGSTRLNITAGYFNHFVDVINLIEIVVKKFTVTIAGGMGQYMPELNILIIFKTC